ncbi:MAG: tetratricopeptide repeat protein [Tildeniella nuda ZEHNDER 1965/U140]|jgi:predicted O-linked N-acetylglucosamine transferase (SPINDLY family)/Tfp pilus assembly protein PilF|nr:tetratricopeptide repeat protein [Tildeniella nuda ZEHNDER 1965/U140]
MLSRLPEPEADADRRKTGTLATSNRTEPMDYQRFMQQLPNLYHHWGNESVQPRIEHFQAVLQQIQGMTTGNVLQLLNFAVACMEPGEVYCEVGCFQGATLTGALLNHPDRMAYAIDNFSEFDVANENQSKLMQNLAAFGLEEQVFFCDQDFESFFADLRALETSDRIGVYLYDGAHDYRSQLMGLLLVKPFLADRALIIVDDSNWAPVQQANWDFIAAHPQCQLILDLPTPDNGYPTFWNGLQVLSWDVQANHHYDWSTLQKASKPGFIQAMQRLSVTVTPHPSDALKALQADASRLRQLGQWAEAAQMFVAILQQDDQRAESWHGLGMTYYLMGRYGEALKASTQAIALNPAIADYHYSLGLVLEKIGDIIAAAHAYQQAIALDSTLTDAYNNLGNLILEHGDAHQAALHYQQAIATKSNHAGSYINLGNALLAQHQFDDAIAAYQTALQHKPQDVAALENVSFAHTLKHDPTQAALFLGDRFYQQQNYQAALEHYQAIATSERDISVYQSLATCYRKLDQLDAAIEVDRQGITHFPQEPNFYLSLILDLHNVGRLKEAVQAATDGIHLFPDHYGFKLENQRLLPLIYQTPEAISWHRQRYTQTLNTLVKQTELVTIEQYKTALEGIGQSTNFLLSYQGHNDLNLQKQYGEFVCKIMAANYPQWSQPLSLMPLQAGEKIRIGYVSGCMWEHTVGKLMIGWLRHHNSARFELYSYNMRDCYDSLTQEYRKYSDAFYQMPPHLEAICEQITANKLHILVFFDLGMQGLMTQLAGLRLAPVQCTTWAHPVTSGLPTVDYFLSSALMEPEAAQNHYSETLIRLPKIGISYAKPAITAPTKTRADFGLREDAVVYLACQLLCKLLPQHDYLFAAIAQQIPQAQFVFIARPTSVYVQDQFKQRLQQAFADFGLDSEQHCVMLPPQVQADYWDLNQRSDIFLDSVSWSGGHTTLEAIACDLPIVTCPGDLMRGRHSYGILTALGMTETIAQTEAEYVKIAVRLGHDPAWRQQVVAQMRDRHADLYDDTACIDALEIFYQQAIGQFMPQPSRH